jgi:hypothetical protein
MDLQGTVEVCAIRLDHFPQFQKYSQLSISNEKVDFENLYLGSQIAPHTHHMCFWIYLICADNTILSEYEYI